MGRCAAARLARWRTVVDLLGDIHCEVDHLRFRYELEFLCQHVRDRVDLRQERVCGWARGSVYARVRGRVRMTGPCTCITCA